ncbi:MAG TPA: glycosyltransferase family 2 protein [Streptosporangiaceae bacterium]
MTAVAQPSSGLVDDDAVEAFIAEYGSGAKPPELAPVAIVIAAYNEADGIADVLKSMPGIVCGQETSTIVVVDGAKDDTARLARDCGGVYVCDVAVNRGQGAALRLGYRLARTCGAEYIITTDADGQYNPAHMETILEPVVNGEADFCSGSRVLGHQETTDRFRRLGVHVFATIISGLTGQRITDTSFGMRAMRAEVTGNVELRQPQYQSSELLIGIIARGYRVVERPAVMQIRSAGKSKKGNNLVYGSRYARVVFGTWLRERKSARRGVPGGRPAAEDHIVEQQELADEQHSVGS